MARVIFVRPKKVVGGNLLFFGAIAGSGKFAVALAKGKDLKLCKFKMKGPKGRMKRESSQQEGNGSVPSPDWAPSLI